MPRRPVEEIPLEEKQYRLRQTWLGGLSEETLGEVARAARTQRWPAHHCLFMRGDAPLAFYILVQGVVRFSRVATSGREMILDIAVPPATFGEISILGKKTRGYTALCTQDTVLLALPGEDVWRLFDDCPDFRHKVAVKLCDRINHYYDSLEDHLLRTLPGRIAKRLLALARGKNDAGARALDAGLSQENLASMFGISRQSLSRQLQEWRDAGWIDIEYGRILIRDEQALRETAQVVK